MEWWEGYQCHTVLSAHLLLGSCWAQRQIRQVMHQTRDLYIIDGMCVC